MMPIAFILSYASCQYVSTIAGSGSASSIEGQGLTAAINNPFGVAFDSTGNLFVTERSANKIRKINTTGFVSTFAGSGSASYGDGQDKSASFNSPNGIFIDLIDNLYVVDNSNQRIRKISSTGYVTTIAGSGNVGINDGQSTSASFNYPFGICVDYSSNIYITDQWNRLVRMVNSSGYVSTIAGGGTTISAVNGQGRNASFSYPGGITLDDFGNIYVADMYSGVIRMINSTGYVSTYAGNGQSVAVDGYSHSASFNGPMGLTIDSYGNLFVGEIYSDKIRMINATGYVTNSW